MDLSTLRRRSRVDPETRIVHGFLPIAPPECHRAGPVAAAHRLRPSGRLHNCAAMPQTVVARAPSAVVRSLQRKTGESDMKHGAYDAKQGEPRIGVDGPSIEPDESTMRSDERLVELIEQRPMRSAKGNLSRKPRIEECESLEWPDESGVESDVCWTRQLAPALRCAPLPSPEPSYQRHV